MTPKKWWQSTILWACLVDILATISDLVKSLQAIAAGGTFNLIVVAQPIIAAVVAIFIIIRRLQNPAPIG